MDVRCERCNTEYEFDDALVSGRGTTVKCTNCGHKFKIRPRSGDITEDFWNVSTADGRTLVFTSLRELQRAIQNQVVERTDRLSRGGRPPKPIGQIPELTPFFDQRDALKAGLPPVREPMQTASGLAPPPPTSAQMRSRPPPPPPGASPPVAAPPNVRQRQSTRPFERAEQPTSTSMKSTLIGPGTLTAEPPPAASVPPPATEREPEPDTQRFEPPPVLSPPPPPPPAPPPVAEATPVVVAAPSAPPARSIPNRTPPPPEVVDTSSPLPPPSPPVLRRQLISEIDEEEEGHRARYASMSDAPGSMGKRRSVGGFVVAAVVVGCVALLGAVWVQKHGLDFGRASKPVPAPAPDPRIASFLTTGEKALADGNLDLAKENFDKAHALAEKDPYVLLDVARLAAARADVVWLKSRLLSGDATEDEKKLTRETLTELSAAARKAADDALAATPEDPAALRAKIDALRISGEPDAARPLVDRIRASAAQPETAYVLAGLDLAEPAPLWSTVIERLRIAAAVESGPGRARAALVYALARSGDVAGARAELERLAALPRQHPLVAQLRSFVESAKPGPSQADAGAALGAGASGVDAAGPAEAAGDGDPKGPRPAGGDALPRDPRQLVSEGEKARARGDYDRARKMYGAALERNANDSEALAGLAAISYAQRDLAGARSGYKRVLSINPNYTPALVGLADVEWESGDRAAAMKIYRDIADRLPEGSYPARVKQRLDAASAPAPAPEQGGGGP